MSTEKKKTVGLSLSGGSTRIAGIGAAAVTAVRDMNFNPEVITGISAGSIVALPLALGKYDEILKMTSDVDQIYDIFDIRPVNKNGKVRGRNVARAILTGKESIGSQDNLKTILQEVISEAEFNAYRKSSLPDVFLGCVNYNTGKIHYFDIKAGSYEDYFNAVTASSSIPVFVDSVVMNKREFDDIEDYVLTDNHWLDGGMVDHIGSHWLMSNDRFDIKKHLSIYSGSQSFSIQDRDYKPKNIVEVMMRTLEILSNEKSKNDHYKENKIAQEKGIINCQIFLNMQTDRQYELRQEIISNWHQRGKDWTKNELEKDKWSALLNDDEAGPFDNNELDSNDTGPQIT